MSNPPAVTRAYHGSQYEDVANEWWTKALYDQINATPATITALTATVAAQEVQIVALQAQIDALPRNAPITDITTARALSLSDIGKNIVFTNASPIAVTVPAGLGSGFSCTLYQAGAGAITVSGSGTTVNGYGSAVATAGQWAPCAVYAYAADTFVLIGNIV